MKLKLALTLIFLVNIHSDESFIYHFKDDNSANLFYNEVVKFSGDINDEIKLREDENDYNTFKFFCYKKKLKVDIFGFSDIAPKDVVKNYVVGNVTVAPGVDPKGIDCDCTIEGDLKVKKISVDLDEGTNNKYYTKTDKFSELYNKICNYNNTTYYSINEELFKNHIRGLEQQCLNFDDGSKTIFDFYSTADKLSITMRDDYRLEEDDLKDYLYKHAYYVEFRIRPNKKLLYGINKDDLNLSILFKEDTYDNILEEIGNKAKVILKNKYKIDIDKLNIDIYHKIGEGKYQKIIKNCRLGTGKYYYSINNILRSEKYYNAIESLKEIIKKISEGIGNYSIAEGTPIEQLECKEKNITEDMFNIRQAVETVKRSRKEEDTIDKSEKEVEKFKEQLEKIKENILAEISKKEAEERAEKYFTVHAKKLGAKINELVDNIKNATFQNTKKLIVDNWFAQTGEDGVYYISEECIKSYIHDVAMDILLGDFDDNNEAYYCYSGKINDYYEDTNNIKDFADGISKAVQAKIKELKFEILFDQEGENLLSDKATTKINKIFNKYKNLFYEVTCDEIWLEIDNAIYMDSVQAQLYEGDKKVSTSKKAITSNTRLRVCYINKNKIPDNKSDKEFEEAVQMLKKLEEENKKAKEEKERIYKQEEDKRKAMKKKIDDAQKKAKEDAKRRKENIVKCINDVKNIEKKEPNEQESQSKNKLNNVTKTPQAKQNCCDRCCKSCKCCKKRT